MINVFQETERRRKFQQRCWWYENLKWIMMISSEKLTVICVIFTKNKENPFKWKRKTANKDVRSLSWEEYKFIESDYSAKIAIVVRIENFRSTF